MRFQCTNPKHKYKIVWTTKQPVTKAKKKIMPFCPDCGNKDHVSKWKK